MHLGFERLDTVLEFWALILASDLKKPKLSLMLPLSTELRIYIIIIIYITILIINHYRDYDPGRRQRRHSHRG